MPQYDFSYTRLASVNPKLAGQAAFAALSNLQPFSPEQRVAGAALLFLLVSRFYGIHPSNALQIADAIYNDQQAINRELKALANYMKHDMEQE